MSVPLPCCEAYPEVVPGHAWRAARRRSHRFLSDSARSSRVPACRSMEGRMAHVTRFAYDVFVSYATIDNEVLVAYGQGWIDVLLDKLCRELKPRLGGRDLKIFVDHEVMRSNL